MNQENSKSFNLIESRKFSFEDPLTSKKALYATLLVFFTSAVLIIVLPWWPIKLILGLFWGFLNVRLFSIYHDYAHGTIFKKSSVETFILKIYGWYICAPLSVWKSTHKFHHIHTAKIPSTFIGTFHTATVNEYESMSLSKKIKYRFTRSIWFMLFGFFTTFIYGFCINPLIANTKKHRDSIIPLIFLVVEISIISFLGSWKSVFFYSVIPRMFASFVGTFLFFVQHNFYGTKLYLPDEWNYEGAAMEASSCLKGGKLFDWLTGNIGYHHIHHMNPSIPFYKYNKILQEFPELAKINQVKVNFSLFKVIRLKLWDESKKELITLSQIPSIL